MNKRARAVLLTLALAAGAGSWARAAFPEAELARGGNRFALELYRRLAVETGNLFYSPYSVSAALAMTYAGARGETAAQMRRALGFDQSGERLHVSFGALDASLAKAGGGGKIRLETANALWGQKGYGFRGEFIALTRRYYGAGLRELDFGGADARGTINAWVEKATQDKIKELIPEGILTANTRLVLTNAIYFKGDWLSQFKKERTQDETFHAPAGPKISPFMKQNAMFPYLDDAELQVLELPYAGERLSMLVLLPKKNDGLAALEAGLSEKRLSDWLARLKPRTVAVSLPRFKAESSFKLAPPLQELGMKDAFSGAADFSGMNGRRDLFIGAVLHKAFVEVNEQGSEAAAATAVVIASENISQPPPAFRADHPFVFLIRDRETGLALFLGRLIEP